jgi:hypothetical protein
MTAVSGRFLGKAYTSSHNKRGLVMRKASAATTIALGLVLTLLFAPPQASACGESLFRVGKGALYRGQVAPLPARIMMVASNDESRGLAERLVLAGHHVHTVADASELAAELAVEEYDIVLAAFRDRDTVTAQTAASNTAPVYLPITLAESEEDLAAQLYDRTLRSRDGFLDFMRAIHRTLKDTRRA